MDSSKSVSELLFASCESAEPWTTFALNPSNYATIWNFKGAELAGVAVNNVAFIKDQFMLLSCVGKPMGHLIGIQSKSRRHVRIPFPGVVSAISVTLDGKICSSAIQDKIYTWLVSTGELLTIVSAHFQDITRLAFSSCGWILVSAGKDGLVQIWNVADLLKPHDANLEKPEPIRKWSSHSLAVTDLFVSSVPRNPRIVTTSMDQTLQVHSLQSEQHLLSAAFDCSLTSCTMDAAETRIFVGTSKGLICQINLFTKANFKRDQHISTIGSSGDCPFFSGHKNEVRRLCLNLDATLLASGDESEIRIWDVTSKQSLKTLNTKGPITTLCFVPAWKSLVDPDYQSEGGVVAELLRRELSTEFGGTLPLKPRGSAEEKYTVEKIINDLVSSKGRITGNETQSPRKKKRVRQESMEEEEMAPDSGVTAELNRARKINKELYEFMVTKILNQ